ncbi:hypothetical protein ARMGADRAFT_430026 [Armillaria gallica]|uniref:Uncharacterized protein n=1 Tax=Armillaria gallica TaxID=47427 RepID=A0A2H3DGX0_ARMGA|nr:hypothetical protein ARMGADRAFT_430026 [Armillaria gallica]
MMWRKLYRRGDNKCVSLSTLDFSALCLAQILSLYSPSIVHAISYHKLIHRYLWRTVDKRFHGHICLVTLRTLESVEVPSHGDSTRSRRIGAIKFKSGDKKSWL